MQRYPVKASHRSRLTLPSLAATARDAFGEAGVDGEGIAARFGALRSLRARPAGRELEVEVEMDPKVAPEIAAETIRRYNRFLEAATGYTAKERAKRLRKSAGAPEG
ncbi:MAG: DUF5611 family protein [Thermoplasmata archaeon]